MGSFQIHSGLEAFRPALRQEQRLPQEEQWPVQIHLGLPQEEQWPVQIHSGLLQEQRWHSHDPGLWLASPQQDRAPADQSRYTPTSIPILYPTHPPGYLPTPYLHHPSLPTSPASRLTDHCLPDLPALLLAYIPTYTYPPDDIPTYTHPPDAKGPAAFGAQVVFCTAVIPLLLVLL